MTLTPFYQAIEDSAGVETRVFLSQKATEIRNLLRTSTRGIIDIGKKLTEAKGRQDHGQFTEWLAIEFGMSQRTAERWMLVAAKFDTLSNFNLDKVSLTALYELAAPSTPDEVREEIIARAEAGETITPAAVKEAIEEVKPTPTAQDADAIYQRWAGQTVPAQEIGRNCGLLSSRYIKAMSLLKLDGRAKQHSTKEGNVYEFAPLAAPAEPVTTSPTLPAVEPVFQPANIPDPRVRFDNALITIASPDGTDALDKGCFDRAIMVGRFLVSNGLWDGQSRVTINNPYALHSRIYGLDHAPASSVIAGTDYVVTLPAPDQAPDQTRSDAQKEAITADLSPRDPDAIAWAAGELPERQREMLLSVWAGAGVVKNAATRIALINRNLLKNGARGKDWWAVIEMTDKGRAVAEYLAHLAADSLRKSAATPPEAEPPADPAPRPQPLTVATAKELIIDALRQSNRALGFNELRKYAGIEGEAPGVYGQAVQEMVAAGSLASFFSHGTGTRYHFPEMVAKLLDDDLPPLTHREFVTVTGLHTRQLRDLLSRPYVLESLDDVQIDGTRQQIRETLDVLRDLQARLGTINGTLIDAQLDLSEARAKAATEAAGESGQPDPLSGEALPAQQEA